MPDAPIPKQLLDRHGAEKAALQRDHERRRKMIELRWVRPTGTHTEDAILQYRTAEFMFSGWKTVPTHCVSRKDFNVLATTGKLPDAVNLTQEHER